MKMPKIYSSLDELHIFLTQEMRLVSESPHSGSWRTYFHNEVIWNPAVTTRTVKILLDHKAQPFKIQLCVSSDNNNSVFILPPFKHDDLKIKIENEIDKLLNLR